VDYHHRLEVDSDDAHRLLGQLTDEPAYVFGSSSGAIVALDLVSKHPEQVRVLVAHEPPAVTLLPDAAQWLMFFDEVYSTYRHSGVDSAMERFNAGVGLDNLPQPPEGIQLPPQVTDMLSRIHGNLDFWLEHELRQYARFVPDIATLRTVPTRLVLAGGQDS
jgi:pimeloyl-ACP methyl ester carboxylesterase